MKFFFNKIINFFKKDSTKIENFLKKHNDNLLDFIKNESSIELITEHSLVNSVLAGKGLEHVEKIIKILSNREKKLRVKLNGEIVGAGKYELLDIKWSQALIDFLRNKSDPIPFRDNPSILQIPDETTISIFGDFGAGDWQESNIATRISQNIKNLNSDYSIHLGDVYYAGSAQESIENFLNFFPIANKGNFSLNSNHEMYDGANGYFNTTLENKIFALQQKNSYFALENSNWIIACLDSAYFSNKSDLFINGNINQSQISFLQNLATKNKKMILLSHHNPVDYFGNKLSLFWEAAVKAAGNNLRYWYFGHTHAAAVYRDIDGVKCRLTGHAAVPYGEVQYFANNKNVIWYENATPIINNDGLRVQNGWAAIKLNGENISEYFYGEDGEVHFKIENK